MAGFHGVAGWELAEFKRREKRETRPDGSIVVNVFGEWTYMQPEEPGEMVVSQWLEGYRLTGRDAR